MLALSTKYFMKEK